MSVPHKGETLGKTSSDICNFLLSFTGGGGQRVLSMLNSKASGGNVGPQVKNRKSSL